MKHIKFILSFVLTAAVFYGLNTKLGSLPPVGKFLAPDQGIWQNETDESISGTVTIPNLSDAETVHYDAQLISHIFAQNNNDLHKAQGYITAKHCLWQMEF